MADRLDTNEPIDIERRKAFKKYAAAVAGGATVAISAKEVLAQASYRGRERPGGGGAEGF